MFPAVLSVSTGVGSCEWLISTRGIRTYVTFWKFSNNSFNSSSFADSVTFIIILHYTCTGPFSWGAYFIGVLDFGLKKNIYLIYFVPLVLRFRMHPNIHR